MPDLDTGAPPIWHAPDGTRWIWNPPTWCGWQPGEDGTWYYDPAEFRAAYPDAPDWDADA